MLDNYIHTIVIFPKAYILQNSSASALIISIKLLSIKVHINILSIITLIHIFSTLPAFISRHALYESYHAKTGYLLMHENEKNL